MSEFKKLSVEITTFINPHLFWIFPSDAAKRREDFVQDLQKHVTNPPIVRNAEKGQCVLVYDTIWKRALVKEESDGHYRCWLKDYGVFHDYDKIYKIPDGYNTKPPLIMQAALSGVVNVKQTLQLTGIESIHTIKFCPGTVKCAKDPIADARKVFFQCLTEENNIHIGKIEILKRDGHIFDLAASLTKQGMLAVNKELFQQALKGNLEMEDSHFLLLTQSVSPCTKPTNKKPNESVQEIVKDLAESKGIGRGTVRGKLVKEAEITPKKKTFVEDWLKDSSKPTAENELNYESDDSENRAPSPNVSTQVLQSPEGNSTVNVSPSDSASVTNSRQTSFEKLKRALIQSRNKQTKCVSSPPSNNSAVSTPTESKRTSSEFNPKKCWSLRYSEEGDEGEKHVMDSRKSDISSVSPEQKETANLKSSPNSKKDNSASEILKSLRRGPGPQSSPLVNKSAVEDASDTASVDDKYIAVLQKKFESKLKMEKPQDIEVSSVKSAPAQPQIEWGTSSKGAANRKSLNLVPAGMKLPEPPKKQNSRTYASVHSSRSSSGAAFQNKEILQVASSCHTSRPSSSTSSVTSMQKLNEYARGLPNVENVNSAVELLKQNCTQGCTCPQCKEWGDEDLSVDNKEFVDTPLKKQKEVVKPTLLLKTENNKNEDVVLKSHASIIAGATKTERAVAPRIVAHGTALPSPVTSITTAPFHAHIHRVLRSFEQVYTIQSYAWPCIMRRNNVCMVGARKSGKTMAYLPAVCSYLFERHERYTGNLPGNTISPIAIILCPGTDVAENVQDLLLKLIEHSPSKPAYAFAVPPVDKKCLNQFQKQCDVLITTPVALISLLHARIITVKRLCHLIIEEANKILDTFSKQIESLLNLLQSMLEHRNCSLSLQMIVSAEHWTLQLENLMKRLCATPVICVGSYLEAALYGRVDIQMHFLHSKNKRHDLVEFLKDKATVCKTVVICNNDAQIDDAKEYLNISGVNTAFVYDTMDKQEIIDMETKWNLRIGGKYLVLVCTDQVFNNSLNITDAVLLVHYSLPDTWTQFSNRFSCLLDNYISPLATKVPDDWVRCMVHVYVDETCTKQFPKLLQLLQRMGTKLSTQFIDYFTQTVKAREEEKLTAKIKLCPNIKLFGRCLSDNRQLYQMATNSEVSYSPLNCKNRHIVSMENDYSNKLPKCGGIKFKIIHVQNVTTFTVNIVEHTDSDGKTHKWKNHEHLHEELQEAMAEQKICVFDVKVGGWYVLYSEKDNTYERCTVQKILQVERITKMASSVSIRCLDSGVQKQVPCSFLYDLPKKFRTIPAQGVDVILANRVPPDSDVSWSSSSKSKVKYMLNEAGYQDEDVFGYGQILLQLGGVIWVENIHLREKLEMVNVTVTKLNLRKSLEDENLISYSEKQLEGLYSLCKNAGIDLPDFQKLLSARKELENKSQQQVQPQWAYFEDCDCNEIYISNVITPGLFYVRLKKFYEIFENLQKDIQEAIAKPFYPKDFEVEVGKYYLAKDFAGDDYCRVKVTEIRENIAECYYVDFGDYSTINIADIKYLTDQHIVKLPFQAIECRLYGVKPAWSGDDWEETAINIIHDYIFEPDTDYYRTLYTTTCKQEPATATDSQRCAILLVDNFRENKIVLINQLLIDCGEAVNVEGEDLDQEFNVPEAYEEPDDVSDVDDVENRELTIEDVQRFAAKHKTDDKINNNNNDTNTNRCESNGSEPSWDIEMDDPETFFKLLIGAKVNDQRETSAEPELPPMRAFELSGHYTPNVVWFQTADLVSFNIMLPDLKDFTLRLTRNRMIMFKTMYDGKQYCLELQLYDKVVKTFEYKTYGQYLKVLLTKCIPIEWPRFIFSSERMRNIKYDLSRIVIPEEEKKTFLKISSGDEDVRGDNCLVDIGSDEDYSESDIESLGSD